MKSTLYKFNQYHRILRMVFPAGVQQVTFLCKKVKKSKESKFSKLQSAVAMLLQTTEERPQRGMGT